MLILAMPIFVSAETDSADAVEQSEAVTENLPSENENATESEISASEETVTDKIVKYVKSHIEEISVMFTLILSMFYEVRKHGKLNGSIGTLNNNAIAVATNSADAINKALAKVEGISDIVQKYKDEICSLIDEIRESEEEKKALKDALFKVKTYLNTAKLANVEFANELAELLCLANIPNSKKDVLYKRHVEFVHKLEEAEEVKYDDGTEA
jgi:hypothetical protein